jgi:hypothetical protein
MLTYVMAVYGQPKMLECWWGELRNYPDDIAHRINLILVDDCGDPVATIPDDVRKVFRAKLLRVTENIPWNQMGARNLGMKHAEGWCIMLDPDMVIDPVMARNFLEQEPKRGEVIRFGLNHMDNSTEGRIDMTSPNTYMIHQEDFFDAGGYDEDYAGRKGWSDVQMLGVLAAHYKMLSRRDLWVRFYGRDLIDDAQVVTLSRSVVENKKLHLRKCAEAKRMGWVKWVQAKKGNMAMCNLRFPWSRVF